MVKKRVRKKELDNYGYCIRLIAPPTRCPGFPSFRHSKKKGRKRNGSKENGKEKKTTGLGPATGPFIHSLSLLLLLLSLSLLPEDDDELLLLLLKLQYQTRVSNVAVIKSVLHSSLSMAQFYCEFCVEAQSLTHLYLQVSPFKLQY